MDYKQMIINLVLRTEDSEFLELIYRFVKKWLG